MNTPVRIAVAAVLVAVALSVPARGMDAILEVQYLGTWEIQPNGDVKVTRVFTLPMMLYNQWKAQNIHMLEMRNYNPAICPAEAVDQNFQWDDTKRTLTLSMTMRGVVVYRDDRWEARMTPGLKFSNIDQGQKKAYFHASMQMPQGIVNGQDVVQFPAAASNLAQKDGTVLTYDMPAAGGSGSKVAWWVLGGICLLAGAALLAMSSKAKA